MRNIVEDIFSNFFIKKRRITSVKVLMTKDDYEEWIEFKKKSAIPEVNHDAEERRK